MKPSGRHSSWGLVLSFFFCQAPALADHLPEKLLASGKPETTLAGINLKTAKLNDVIRMLGKPTRKKQVPNNPSWTGYIWVLPQAKIELGVNKGSSAPEISDIYIEGSAKGQIGSTGQGLKFGDSIQALRRIYGKHFKLDTLSNGASRDREEFTGVTVANQRATIQWKQEEFTLSIGFNSDGKVNAMWLLLPECYGGCE